MRMRKGEEAGTPAAGFHKRDRQQRRKEKNARHNRCSRSEHEQLNNHRCRFAQKTWRQNDGGSIGKELTGEVADVVRSRWSLSEFKKVARDATKDIMTK